jgi:hypothetical protein
VAILCGDEEWSVAEFVANVNRYALGQDGSDFFVPAVACAGEEEAESVGGWGGAWVTGVRQDDWRRRSEGEGRGGGEGELGVEPVPSVSLDEEMEEEEEEEEDVIEATTAASSGTEPVRRLRSSRT